MLVKFIFGINYLSFNGTGKVAVSDTNNPEKVIFYLTNDYSFRNEFFTEPMLFYFGQVIKEYPAEAVYAYCTEDIDFDGKDEVEIKAILTRELRNKYNYVQSLMVMCWFVKDCCLSVSNGMADVPELAKMTVTITSNSVLHNSLGKLETVTLMQSDILLATQVYSKYQSLMGPQSPPIDDEIEWIRNKDGKPIKAFQGLSSDFDYGTYNCIDRAMVFLNSARKAQYFVYKIAYYIPILECLFTTDKFEVTQKVSERVAFYIEEDEDERIAMYDFIKEVYDIRSTFLHGQKFKSKNIQRDVLEPHSIRLDEVVRAILTLVIMHDSDYFVGTEQGIHKNDVKEKRDKYLKYLMFSKT
jgi:hypothetical protein